MRLNGRLVSVASASARACWRADERGCRSDDGTMRAAAIRQGGVRVVFVLQCTPTSREPRHWPRHPGPNDGQRTAVECECEADDCRTHSGSGRAINYRTNDGVSDICSSWANERASESERTEGVDWRERERERESCPSAIECHSCCEAAVGGQRVRTRAQALQYTADAVAAAVARKLLENH